MLGKRAVPATRRKVEKKWKEGNSSDEDEEKPVTDADFDDFRRRNEEEEKEERRRKWAEAQEKKRIEDLAASKRGRTKAFEWMDSDDECDEAEEDDDTGKKTKNGKWPNAFRTKCTTFSWRSTRTTQPSNHRASSCCSARCA